MVTMDEMSVNMLGRVLEIDIKGDLRHRFFDLGLVENTEIKCVGKSPWGDPKAFLIRGAVIAVRKEEAKKITVDIS